MKFTITLAAGVAALAVGAVSAHAGCADPRAIQAGAVHTLPAFIVGNLAAKAAASASAHPGGDAAQNIVGTWLVSYQVRGMPAGQALIQWHSDGTEFENINFPVLGGNMCLGSWKAVDATHVSRFHMGWLYDNGNLSGYFNQTETVRAAYSHYVGVSDFKVFDLNGNVLTEFTERSDAVRLEP
ncbi:MAG: hypothetical protein ACR2FH_03210 [Caulobacteraceae bacterium]